MFTLFHFALEMVKIAIQSAVYTSIIMALLFALTKTIWLNRVITIKFSKVYFTVAGLLLVFSFTYYGDHGIGDEDNIPLGNMKTMNSNDGYAYFYLEPNKQINVDSFLVRNDHLCFSSENIYYDYQLISGKWTKYNSEHEYEAYALACRLPHVNEFKTFYQQYADYWNGWRFWFFP
jgi:hypothetical protein